MSGWRVGPGGIVDVCTFTGFDVGVESQTASCELRVITVLYGIMGYYLLDRVGTEMA